MLCLDSILCPSVDELAKANRSVPLLGAWDPTGAHAVTAKVPPWEDRFPFLNQRSQRKGFTRVTGAKQANDPKTLLWLGNRRGNLFKQHDQRRTNRVWTRVFHHPHE